MRHFGYSSHDWVQFSFIIVHYFSDVFTLPIDGTYLLTVYAVTAETQNGPVYIKNNDAVLCAMRIIENLGQNGAPCSTIVQLEIGESVRVTGDGADAARIQGGYSGFAGYIISDEITA